MREGREGRDTKTDLCVAVKDCGELEMVGNLS